MSRETKEREIQLAAQSIRQRLNVTGLASTLEQRAFLALLADRDRLAAELARVRRNHLRRMEHDAIDLTCVPFRFTPRDHARLNRIIEGCRAALAQTQDGTTEGRG